MSTTPDKPAAPPAAATAELLRQLEADAPVRLELGGARLHVERPVPYLCVYREPGPGDPRPRTHLAGTESAELIATGPLSAEAREAVRALIHALADRFGAFLLLELWCEAPAVATDGHPGGRHPAAGSLTLHSPTDPPPAVEVLRGALAAIRLEGAALTVTVAPSPAPTAPPDHQPLLDAAEARRWEVLQLGLAVTPFYLHAAAGFAPYPLLLSSLRRQLSPALRKAAHAFARVQTTFSAPHHHAFGTAAVGEAARAVDAALAEVAEGFRFLFLITPVNVEAARADFAAGDHRDEPVFHYRLLPVDPALALRRLYAIPVERVADPTLARLFAEKRDELARTLTMLAERDTPRFRCASQEVFGGVDPALLAVAEGLLAAVPREPLPSPTEAVSAEAFAKAARAELAHLRAQDPGVGAEVFVRADVSGVLVSEGSLYVGADFATPRRRVDALLQHEVGTHVLTYWNGRAQPLRLLAGGAAGYEALQEGLAVLAEWFVDGLTNPRLRLLAARVVGVHLLLSGASFAETYHALRHDHGLSERGAFAVAMRVHRGGGLTKDAVYLRGLVDLLAYLRGGGALEPLLVGKVSPEYLPLVEELTYRGILRPPPLRPRYVTADPTGFSRKLERLRQGMTVFHLINFGA